MIENKNDLAKLAREDMESRGNNNHEMQAHVQVLHSEL